MKSGWLGNAVIVALAVLIAIDGCLCLYVRAISGIPESPDLLYRAERGHGTSRPPVGFTSTGEKVMGASGARLGWAIRYAAKDCQFCKRNEPLWDQTATELEQYGYKVIVLVPTANDAFAPGTKALAGADQEVYVDTEWIKQFRLSLTPTLLIFGASGNLIWAREGTLTVADPAAIMRTIRAQEGKE